MANTSTISRYSIGIDLGTTYSCVGVFRNGKVEIIDNDMGNRTTPSYVAFTEDERLVGEAAKKHASQDPSNTVYDVKRMIGRRFDDQKVQQNAKRWPFKVSAQDNLPNIEVTYKGKEKKFKPEEISAMMLGKMRQKAESYLEEEVTKAVITVPAYFNDSQRKATIDAGKIAGLEVLRIINEPTAAGYCYGMDKLDKGNRNVLIFDLGGGTFDATILNIDKETFTVKSTAGDLHLGGVDFDNFLVDYCIQKLKEKHGSGINIDKCAIQIIRSKCEEAKITLSSASQTVIKLDFLFALPKFSLTITRALLEQLCDRLFRSTLETVSRVLADSKLSKAQIDDIVLVGGSTRIPKIQQLLQEFFDGRELRRSVNPDLAVAHGAAIQAAILNQGECRQAIQNLQLCDVTPLSLGTEIGFYGAMSIVVERNTPIPIKKQEIRVTASDDQTRIRFKVFEGERPLVKDNHFLGEFVIDGIPPAPRGVEEFTLTFDIDENGILSVSAVNHSTGNHREITISNSGQMPHSEIKRLIKEAELMRKDDEDVRLRIAAKDELERLVYKLKRNISETDTENYDEILEQLGKAQELLDRDEIDAKELYDNQRMELQRLSNIEL